MTDKSAAAVRELAEKWGYTLEGWIDPLTGHPGRVLQPAPDKCLADLTALISEHYVSKEDVNQEVEKRIAERMSDDEIKSTAYRFAPIMLYPGITCMEDANLSIRQDIIEMLMLLRSRLTNPGDSQKTEGGNDGKA